MPATGDFAKLDALSAAFAHMSRDGMGATRAAMQATRLVSEHAFDQEREPTGRPWAPLAPATLRRRRPGPKLRGLLSARRWQLLAAGRWRVFDKEKPYDIFHTMGTRRMPQRADLPVNPGGMLVYGGAVHEAIGDWIRDNFKRAGL